MKMTIEEMFETICENPNHPDKLSFEENFSHYGYYSSKYANLTGSPFPSGEEVIAEDDCFSYYYAKNVLKGRFIQGEKAISKNAKYSYLYAKNVLKGAFPEGEDIISKYSAYSYYYAVYIIKERFPQGELIISENSHYWKKYKENFKF
jgi:lambda repressor-like predicted transcriptional regulator